MRRTIVGFAIATLVATTADAQQKRPLDHDVYDSWNSVREQQLSKDGQWILYTHVPGDGDAELHVKGLGSSTEYTVARGQSAEFTADGQWVIFLIKPELALQREAQKEKKRPDDQPKDSLGILNLSTGDITRIERVKSFEVPEDGSGWLAFLLEEVKEEESEADTTEAEEPAEPEEEQEEEEDDDEKKEKKDGTPLVLRELSSGSETRFELVMEYEFAKNGSLLAYTSSSKDGETDGAFAVETASGQVVTLLAGEGNYKSLVFDEDGEQVAFLSDRDDYESDQPAYSLYHWNDGEAQAVASEGTPGIPQDWWVSEHGDLEFSENGRRLFFGTAPRPEPEPEEEPQSWEEVKVDIWNWKDPLLQPQQLVQRQSELERTYDAVVHLRSGQVVQLADKAMPNISLVADGDADLALGTSNLPYRQRISWDSPGYQDVYVVDVRTGDRRMLLEELQGDASLSPEAKYIVWWNGHERAWFAMSVEGGQPVNLSDGIPYPVYNELHDWPRIHSSYGSAGWTEGDGWFLIYDVHDIWATDPTGRNAPRNVTEGVGRSQKLQFRYIRLDPEQDAIPEREPMLLRTLDRTTKAAGFYRDVFRGDGQPEELVMQDKSFGFSVRKAEEADVLMFNRSSFEEFPDLWVSDLSLGNMRKMSDANPQMAEYWWGTSELIHWRSTDGKAIDGILYKPENFDPAMQYPMMVYFYEKMSDGLHSFRNPTPGSSVSVSFYVSRGYVVFIPDVHYRVGYPGESALDCIVPGILSILEEGFVDPARIGVQGHSWGGYQIAHMITQTDIFAAAEAGAPVSNMTSAYGGIRWASGMNRAMQYEKTQSRIGATLWEGLPRYIENSPLFWADKVNTPVLMLHNDEDGAVPWYQGIEFFTALRRLGKPTWLVNYNGEPHGVRKYQNRKDWAERMQQFFDHYLQGAPAPVWLVEGVPAVMKGKTLGLELVEETKPTTAGGGR